MKAEPDGIGKLIRGIIRRYVSSVLLDAYANAFDFTVEDKVSVYVCICVLCMCFDRGRGL